MLNNYREYFEIDRDYYFTHYSPEEMVKEFNVNFAPDTVSETVGFPDEDLRNLKVKLIAEEVRELADAEEADDLVETLDALADIIYVIYGYAHALGVNLDHFVAEVHASNMSKLGEDGKPIRREDGKVLKGPNFAEPDIKGVLKAEYGYVGFE